MVGDLIAVAALAVCVFVLACLAVWAGLFASSLF
jgi:hypothetical protein